MSKLGNELVATYYFGTTNAAVHVYGCWDEETPENKFSFYDLFENGKCINEGDPFEELPTREQVWEFLQDYLNEAEAAIAKAESE